MLMQAQIRLQNKEFVVEQIENNKNKTKEERNNKLKEEKQVIQDAVKDINNKVFAIKDEVVAELGDKTKNNKKIIDRIGNKTSFFWTGLDDKKYI